ncbi:MAG: hypothetical protein GF320_15580 [Armatimonadia bacterium]|nr:hypothetical protein [Armatimonadia bacterium]
MQPIALHTCCGPCAASVVPQLRQSGMEPVAHYSNPNIHPAMEWLRRLEALESYAASSDIALAVEPEYGLSRFLDVTRGLSGRDRCERCFLLRLTSTAKWAAEGGMRHLTTTLLTSPYQDRELIVAVGERVAGRHGLAFVPADFREGFRAGQDAARELGLYRQPYCGCVFSEAERYQKKLAREYAKRSESPPP